MAKNKKALVYYSDIGIFGTFVNFEQHPSEKDFVYLKYVPEGSFFKKVIKYEKPIHISSIHWQDPVIHVMGVPDRICLIYTGEQGSISKSAFNNDYDTEINELRAKNKSLEMKNTSLTQDLENARAGVSKAVSSARSITRNKVNDDSLLNGFNSLRPHTFRNDFDS